VPGLDYRTKFVNLEDHPMFLILVTLTHLQNAANIAYHDIAPSWIMQENKAKFDSEDDLDPAKDDNLGLSNHQAHTIPVEEKQVYLPCNGNLTNVKFNL
jgi:hypothetical protein